jgi:hypothetical protein
MKKAIFTLVILLAGLTQLAAQSKKAILKIMLSDGNPLTVTVNNRQYSKHGKAITISDLPAGNQYIRVYEYKPYRDERGGNARLIYSGYVRTRRNTLTVANINPATGAMRVKTMVPEDENNNPYREEDNYRRHDNNSLSSRDIDDLKKRVEDRITDTDKMKLMKSALGNSNYYTGNVQQMMSWLSFESSRLEFAKWAYTNVIDSKNYSKLESEFSFSSSKDEFNEYIQSKQ